MRERSATDLLAALFYDIDAARLSGRKFAVITLAGCVLSQGIY